MTAGGIKYHCSFLFCFSFYPIHGIIQLPCGAIRYCSLFTLKTVDANEPWFATVALRLTDELVGFVQPGKQLLAVVVVDWDAHEVALADEVRLGAGVAGVQHVGDAILGHQVLQRDTVFSLRPRRRGDETRVPPGAARRPESHLVEDVLLRAQVEVRQDSRGPHVGHGQARLRQAHGEVGGGLPFTQAGEAGGESGEASCTREKEGGKEQKRG